MARCLKRGAFDTLSSHWLGHVPLLSFCVSFLSISEKLSSFIHMLWNYVGVYIYTHTSRISRIHFLQLESSQQIEYWYFSHRIIQIRAFTPLLSLIHLIIYLATNDNIMHKYTRNTTVLGCLYEYWSSYPKTSKYPHTLFANSATTSFKLANSKISTSIHRCQDMLTCIKQCIYSNIIRNCNGFILFWMADNQSLAWNTVIVMNFPSTGSPCRE